MKWSQRFSNRSLAIGVILKPNSSYYKTYSRCAILPERLSVIGTKRSSSRFTSMVTVAKRSVSNLA